MRLAHSTLLRLPWCGSLEVLRDYAVSNWSTAPYSCFTIPYSNVQARVMLADVFLRPANCYFCL